MIPPSDIVQSCCAGATTLISVDAKTDGSSKGDTMPAVKRVGRRAVPGKRLKSILKGGGHSASVDGVEKFMQVSQLEGGVGGVPATSSAVLQRKSALSAQEKNEARRLIRSPERTVPTIQSGKNPTRPRSTIRDRGICVLCVQRACDDLPVCLLCMIFRGDGIHDGAHCRADG